MCASSITGTRSRPSFLAARTRPCPAMMPSLHRPAPGWSTRTRGCWPRSARPGHRSGCADCGHTGSARPAAARRSQIVHPQNLTKCDESRATCGQEFGGFRRKAAGYPPPEFRGHTRATARPVPAGRSRRQMTSPPGAPRLGVSPSGPRARSWRHGRACKGAAIAHPRTALVAPVRHDVVDHCCGLQPTRRPARQRIAGDAPGTRPGPGASGDRSPGAPRSGAAGPARAFTAAALLAPGGRCTGGFEGNGGSIQQQRRSRRAGDSSARARSARRG